MYQDRGSQRGMLFQIGDERGIGGAVGGGVKKKQKKKQCFNLIRPG